MKTNSKNKLFSARYLRQRKFLLFLPLLVLPSVTVIFYLLGGGTAATANTETSQSKRGLNTSLPSATTNGEENWNKMQYYEKADKDSVKHIELVNNDHNYLLPNQSVALNEQEDTIASTLPVISGPSRYLPTTKPVGSDRNEEKVYAKLNELNKALNSQSDEAKRQSNNYSRLNNKDQPQKEISRDIGKLEKLMKMSESKNEGDDPEINEINGMLEKIMDVQHPDKVRDKLQQESARNKTRTFPVSVVKEVLDVTLLTSNNLISRSAKDNVDPKMSVSTGFYSLDTPITSGVANNAIAAVTEETQSLVTGSTLKLRLRDDVYVQGLLVPKNTFVFGFAQLDGERLKISISSFRVDNSILPVALAVYDLDGLEGIRVPGSMSRDAIKTSSEQTLQNIGIGKLDPSLKAQAATAGIEAAKSLLNKKAKLVNVTIKAGYELLLRDTSSLQN